MTAESGSSTVLVGVVVVVVASVKFGTRQRRGRTFMYKVYLSLQDQRLGVLFLVINLGRRGGVEVESYFDSAGGCWTTRTPGMRAGLKDRSQSAYAAPAPKPVERATGHARPETSVLRNGR